MGVRVPPSGPYYKAAAWGITIESVESTLEGDLDSRSLLEVSDEEREGFKNIRASVREKSDASPEKGGWPSPGIQGLLPIYRVLTGQVKGADYDLVLWLGIE